MSLYIHECSDKRACSLAFAPLERDWIQDEIAEAARALVRKGRGECIFSHHFPTREVVWTDAGRYVRVKVPPTVDRGAR